MLWVVEAFFVQDPTAQLVVAQAHQRWRHCVWNLVDPISTWFLSTGWFVSQWEAVEPSALGNACAAWPYSDRLQPASCRCAKRSVRKL